MWFLSKEGQLIQEPPGSVKIVFPVHAKCLIYEKQGSRDLRFPGYKLPNDISLTLQTSRYPLSALFIIKRQIESVLLVMVTYDFHCVRLLISFRSSFIEGLHKEHVVKINKKIHKYTAEVDS